MADQKPRRKNASRVEINNEAFTQIRQAAPLMGLINNQAIIMAFNAQNMAQIKDARYASLPVRKTTHGCIALVTTGEGKTREHVLAKIDNAKYNTLAKAVGMGGAA